MREHFGKNQFVRKKWKPRIRLWLFQLSDANKETKSRVSGDRYVSVSMGEKCNIFMHLYLATELTLKSLSYNIYILNHSSIHVAWLSKKWYCVLVSCHSAMPLS